MFISRPRLLTLLYFFFFHDPQIYPFTGNFPPPYSRTPFHHNAPAPNCVPSYANNVPHPSPVVSSPNPPPPPPGGRGFSVPGPKLRIVSVVFGPGQKFTNTFIFSITVVIVIVYILRQFTKSNSGDDLNNNVVASSSPSEEQNGCRRFSLSQIRSATGDFNHKSVIGKGGFGKVYKGEIRGLNTIAAIKRAKPQSHQGANEFWNEVRMLPSFRHSNLVSLIGYCDENSEMILVYPYMARGSLFDNLYGASPPLSWPERLNVCIGVARGLEYLHNGTGFHQRVIHRDIKSGNILLDEFGAAKISDFGMSKFGPANQSCTSVFTEVKGTPGYEDPDYRSTRKLSKKSDVYSFGVVLLEVLCGQLPSYSRCVDPDDSDGTQYPLVHWAQHCIRKGTPDELIHTTLKGQISPKCLQKFVGIAGKCVRKRSNKRPTIAQVLAKLEQVLMSHNSSSMDTNSSSS